MPLNGDVPADFPRIPSGRAPTAEERQQLKQHRAAYAGGGPLSPGISSTGTILRHSIFLNSGDFEGSLPGPRESPMAGEFLPFEGSAPRRPMIPQLNQGITAGPAPAPTSPVVPASETGSRWGTLAIVAIALWRWLGG